MDNILELDSLSCAYAGQRVVNDLSLNLQPGMLSCLLGPSGCGKTTVLRAIAGFEPVLGGAIRLAGRCVARPGYSEPPETRGLGMVFQDYALFPHLDVAANIGFGIRNLARHKGRERVEQLLDVVGLNGLGGRYPHELSGGQQQRVALARALAPRPALMLLDEPFSNLDIELRERLATEVRDILRTQGTAAMFVTHDQHEAFVMGERIAVMDRGRVVQWDTAFNLYHDPQTRFVADFVGEGRFVPGVLRESDRVESPLGPVRGDRAYLWPRGTQVEMLLRPDDIQLGPGAAQFPHPVVVTARAFRGAETLYTVQMNDGLELISLMPSRYDYTVGQSLGARLTADHLILFMRG